MSFGIDGMALFIAVGAVVILYLLTSTTPEEPTLHVSSLQGFLPPKTSWRALAAPLPRRLMLIGFALFLLAFIDPHLLIEKEHDRTSGDLPAVEGVALYLVLDQSGSMRQPVRNATKMDLLKDVAERFVEERPNDLLGLVAFARTARVIVPLTLDHALIMQKIAGLQPVQDPSQDGTAIGYAIYKTASLIAATRHFGETETEQGKKPAYEIKGAAMILVTDGLQDPNPEDRGNRLRTIDLEEAAEFARKEKVRIYLVSVEPRLATEAFVPHRRLMQRVAKETGGEFFLAESPERLTRVFQEIDQLEKSTLPRYQQALLQLPKDKQPNRYRRVSLYPGLIALGILALAGAWILSTTVLRRSP